MTLLTRLPPSSKDGACRKKSHCWSACRTRDLSVSGAPRIGRNQEEAKTGETPRCSDRKVKKPFLLRLGYMGTMKDFDAKPHKGVWKGAVVSLHSATTRCHYFGTVRNILIITTTLNIKGSSFSTSRRHRLGVSPLSASSMGCNAPCRVPVATADLTDSRTMRLRRLIRESDKLSA